MTGQRLGHSKHDDDDNIVPTLFSMEKHRRLFSGSDSNGQENNDSSDGSAYNSERIEIRNGYPVRYKCVDAIQQQVEAELIDISFLYEVVVSKDSGLAENLRALEWSILWNIVHDIGLNRCDFEKQANVFETTMASVADQGGNGLRRVLADLENPDTAPSYILSLSSDLEDMMDRETGTCQYTPSTASSTICIPIRGSMYAMYTGHQSELIERFLLEEIRKVMKLNSMRVESVQGVTYVGQFSPAKAANTSIEAPSTSGASSTALLLSVSIGIIAVLAFLLVAGLAVLRMKRHGFRMKLKDGNEILSPDLAEVPTTSTDSSDTRFKDVASVKRSKENVEQWESLQPQTEDEHDGVVGPLATTVPAASIYLASTRQRQRKRTNGLKRRPKSLPARASVAPFGIEPIPEADGDFGGAPCDLESPDSEAFASSEDESDDGRQFTDRRCAGLPNTSPPSSPLVFCSSSSTSFEINDESCQTQPWTPSFD